MAVFKRDRSPLFGRSARTSIEATLVIIVTAITIDLVDRYWLQLETTGQYLFSLTTQPAFFRFEAALAALHSVSGLTLLGVALLFVWGLGRSIYCGTARFYQIHVLQSLNAIVIGALCTLWVASLLLLFIQALAQGAMSAMAAETGTLLWAKLLATGMASLAYGLLRRDVKELAALSNSQALFQGLAFPRRLPLLQLGAVFLGASMFLCTADMLPIKSYGLPLLASISLLTALFAASLMLITLIDGLLAEQ